MTEQAIRLAVISKLAWIKRRQHDFAKQPRQLHREMVSGESHYLWGRKYRLEMLPQPGKHCVRIKGPGKLLLNVNHNTSTENRLKALNEFYRAETKHQIEQLMERWQPTIDVEASTWGVKKMKTKWGSCNTNAKRIWLNLELAKKPPECLEYILVHELVHLLERHHNARLKELMDRFMPNWRERRDLLNSLPLAYEDWQY